MGLLSPPRLADLSPELVTWNPVQRCTHRAFKLNQAQGIYFECPCGDGHIIGIWFKQPDVLPPAGADAPPNDKRWSHSGTSLDDLTLSPSISLPCWHGFITDGRVTSV